MSEAHPIHEGQVLTGSLFNEPIRVENVREGGLDTWVVGLVGIQSERFRKVTLTSRDIVKLTILDSKFCYGADGRLLRLGPADRRAPDLARPGARRGGQGHRCR